MRLSKNFWTLLIGVVAVAVADTVPVYIQPVTSPETAPALLAEISYDAAATTTDLDAPGSLASEILSYEAPEIPEGAQLARIGIYDKKAARWGSSTTVISVNNFGKGYSPHFVLTVDVSGKDYLSIACRGVRVDAGYTRDFGPQVAVVVAGRGKQPELNKPVVLSPEGKKVAPEEKTFLQKYTSTQAHPPLVTIPHDFGLGLLTHFGRVDIGGYSRSACSCWYPAEATRNDIDTLYEPLNPSPKCLELPTGHHHPLSRAIAALVCW